MAGLGVPGAPYQLPTFSGGGVPGAPYVPSGPASPGLTFSDIGNAASAVGNAVVTGANKLANGIDAGVAKVGGLFGTAAAAPAVPAQVAAPLAAMGPATPGSAGRIGTSNGVGYDMVAGPTPEQAAAINRNYQAESASIAKNGDPKLFRAGDVVAAGTTPGTSVFTNYGQDVGPGSAARVAAATPVVAQAPLEKHLGLPGGYLSSVVTQAPPALRAQIVSQLAGASAQATTGYGLGLKQDVSKNVDQMYAYEARAKENNESDAAYKDRVAKAGQARSIRQLDIANTAAGGNPILRPDFGG